MSLLTSVFLPDSGALFATARALDRHAEDYRRRAAAVATAADAAHWRSLAADAFRARVAHLGSDLRRGAGRVDTAADALRRHARVVELEVEAARALADGVLGVVRSGLRAVGR